MHFIVCFWSISVNLHPQGIKKTVNTFSVVVWNHLVLSPFAVAQPFACVFIQYYNHTTTNFIIYAVVTFPPAPPFAVAQPSACNIQKHRVDAKLGSASWHIPLWFAMGEY